jgi:acyl carrier protein
MVPSAILVLDELPLSANGKVDWRRLPSFNTARIEGERPITPPRTPVEEKLAGIFADLLGRDPVSIDDNFFELGGHSLLAIQAVSRARQALGVELPLTCLFQKPTVAGIAESVAAIVLTETGNDEPPMLRVRRPGVFPLLSSQLSIWDFYRRHPGKTLVNPSRAYRLHGPLSVEALHEALAALVERHEALRTNFVEIDGSPSQRIRAARRPELPLFDLSRLTEPARLAEAQRCFDDETEHCFDLANDSPIRPRLLRLDDEDHVLILIFSHMIMDGWSLNIFNTELSALYTGFAGGRQRDLPELVVQPADVACWERRYFQCAAAQRQVAYWRNHLLDAPLQAGIPYDGPQPEPGDFRAVRQSLVVPGKFVEALRELGRQEGCTLAMTLFAAVNALFHEATGQQDIRVGTSLAARTRPEVEGLIGCFRKRVILRTDVSGRPTFRELLGRVREVSMGAYLHLDVSQETVFPERSVDHPAHQTRVPINFLFFERSRGSLQLPGLASTGLERSHLYMWGPLSIHVLEQENGIRVNVMSSRNLFSVNVIKGLLERYHAVLRRFVSEPNQRMSRVATGKPLTNAENSIGT